MFELFRDANKKLHETNENLREALDSRASVIKQFNLVGGFMGGGRNTILENPIPL